MKKEVLIFIDIAAPKNALQTEVITETGLEPYFFVNRYNSKANSFLKNPGSQIVLENNFFKRLRQVNGYLKKNKRSIHHLEVYPGGRLSFLYVLLAKIYKIKCICAERGDIINYHKNGSGFLTRLSMWFCYNYSDLIWYREPYMKPKLEKFNKKLYFLHNAIKINEKSEWIPTSDKDITFLWMNRAIPQRRSDWFIDVLRKPELQSTKNYLIGILPSSEYTKEQEYIQKNKPDNLIVNNYCEDPQQFYKRSKFFILPADVVFANHALLESMSYGVVPLVSDQIGTSLIAENGKNGFVFNHSKKQFEETVLKALSLSDEDYDHLSVAAREKIINDFSEAKYKAGIKEMYSLI